MDAGLKAESDTEEWRLQGKAESREKQTRQSKGGKKKVGPCKTPQSDAASLRAREADSSSAILLTLSE